MLMSFLQSPACYLILDFYPINLRVNKGLFYVFIFTLHIWKPTISNVLIPKMYFKPTLSGRKTQEQDHTHKQGAQRLPRKQLSHIHNPDLLLPQPAQILVVGFTLMLNCFMISVYGTA